MSTPLPKTFNTYNLYGAFAFAMVVLTCFSGYYFTNRFYTSEVWVIVTFTLGALYTALGVLGDSLSKTDNPRNQAIYFLTQCALVTPIVFMSPLRGFMGIIVLPLLAEGIFELRARYAALLGAYLAFITIAVWGFDYGWSSAFQAVNNYSAAFAFTTVFSLITKKALSARAREEALRLELEEANRQLREQATQTEELATTRERNRLAREIHDGVGHYLTVVKTQLDAAAALITTQPERARESVEKASKLTHEALEDVRRSVGTLRTDAERPPLRDSIRQLAAELQPLPEFVVLGPSRQLSAAAEHALFRATQEALTNIRKHAHATAARITLDFTSPHHVRLTVTDNGRGRHGPPASVSGFGLRGLRERIEVLGGKFAAAPVADGFSLTAELPA